MTALWVACPAVEVERNTVNISTEIKIKIFSLRFSFSRGRRRGLQTPNLAVYLKNIVQLIPRRRYRSCIFASGPQ